MLDRNYMVEEAERVYLLGLNRPGTCMCGRDVEHLFATPSQTFYSKEEEDHDPNAELMLCLDCSIDYTEMMDEQWRDYYSSTR